MGRPESPHRPQVISARDLPDTTRRLAASRHRAAPLMLASIPGFQPGQVRQHPAPVMGQQPVRGQRPRQPASQPRLVGQHPQQRRPRRASSRLNPARGAPVDHMGGFGNAQRNAVTAAAIAITLTRRIAEPGRTEQPFRRGKMAATGPGRADHIGGSRVTFRDRFQRSAPVPSPSRGPPAGRRHPGVLSGGAGNVCGDYVSGVPVQRRPGTLWRRQLSELSECLSRGCVRRLTSAA